MTPAVNTFKITIKKGIPITLFREGIPQCVIPCKETGEYAVHDGIAFVAREQDHQLTYSRIYSTEQEYLCVVENAPYPIRIVYDEWRVLVSDVKYPST